MAKRISEFTDTLRQIGEIQVTDWDFIGLLNNDIDLAQSLRKIGNLKVNDWDFSTVMPKVHKLANTEVELPDVVVRAANYKILDWDFRSSSSSPNTTKGTQKLPSPEQTEALKTRLSGFVRFMMMNLISEPNHTEVRIEDLGRAVLRVEILVTKKDIKELIGRDGATAASMRGILKSAAAAAGFHALLDIKTHEEALATDRAELKPC
ncbi:KH domain-containing protein [Haloferula sp.]|uniref:KH domain-containing protein n=1 Tax=Haloferula sp. TaxID=2497595 RepID=UPI003C75255C